MPGIDPTLRYWAWGFLVLYVCAMLAFGFIGMRRVRSGDDFATARGGYGPLFLALALTATSASGGTFIGLPALAYSAGFSALWYALVYPVAIYVGIMVAVKVVRRAGERFGSRSIPEFLGDRYQSDALRIIVAVFSLMLMFYLAAQLLAGAVLFIRLMGLEILPALIITSVVLLVYIVIGGAHADIITDGVQGALMLALSIAGVLMFATGFGVDGGFAGMLTTLNALDPDLTTVIHPSHPILNSWWAIFAIAVTHAPAGMMPHVGNKLWALRSDRERRRFLVLAFCFAVLLAAVTASGVLARAVLGDALLLPGTNPNDALPMLFIALLPPWLAAMIGAGILAAVMSTADGLLVSTSQIFANDLYRRTFAPRMHAEWPPADVEQCALSISRVSIVGISIVAVWLAWISQSMNVAVLVWTGVGGFGAGLFGPVFAGIMWRRSTRVAAIAAFVGGATTFLILKLNVLGLVAAAAVQTSPIGAWLVVQSGNPFACATLGSAVSLLLMLTVTPLTNPPTPAHLRQIFDD